MTNRKFHKLFGGPARKSESKLELHHMNLARSIQEVTQDVILKMAKHVYNKTGQENLCLAGGVALNCVANANILRNGPFKRVWIQPASTDAGGSLGAALSTWYKYLNKPRTVNEDKDSQKASLLGPSFGNDKIKEFLDQEKAQYRQLQNQKISKTATEIISNEKVLGWFQGRMEFGPRALGARSILGDARSKEMQSIINLKIKFRESFRPFAPSVLLDKAKDYFDTDYQSPYMLLIAPVKEEKRINQESKNLLGLDKLKVKRSQIPAVTHVDCTARLQTVKRKDNPLYYDLIDAFYQKTGCPAVINTSFNVRGEPIVCTPSDAYQCFMRTNMDYLIMGNFLLDKTKQDKSKIKLEAINKDELD